MDGSTVSIHEANVRRNPDEVPDPSVGEHTTAILYELGYDEGSVAWLRREGAV